MKMLSETKVAVVHGLCNIDPSTAENYYNFPRGKENKAFSHIHLGTMPQVKSRMFEAAFAKCVILCQRDQWNPIEYFFEPARDFMYFDDEADLDRQLRYVLENYDLFDSMRENAYNKAVNNYTTKHFVEKYLM
jgi:spore maturation protein CgeB